MELTGSSAKSLQIHFLIGALSEYFISRALNAMFGLVGCKVEQGLHLQRMSSPDLTAVLYMSLDTPLLHVLCHYLAAVAQKVFLAPVNKFFELNAQSYHFSCSLNERMANYFFEWLL